jgi:hypothetical protein
MSLRDLSLGRGYITPLLYPLTRPPLTIAFFLMTIIFSKYYPVPKAFLTNFDGFSLYIAYQGTVNFCLTTICVFFLELLQVHALRCCTAKGRPFGLGASLQV